MIESFTQRCQQRVNARLAEILTTMPAVPKYLQKAMCYVVLNGGKRIRPLMMYASAEMLGVGWHKLDTAACAIEFIHAYSLVHDDLPAMDNDDFRRGLPTCHRAFDEATAILVGDALQSVAFEVLSQDKLLLAEQRLELIKILARVAGPAGMVGGQAMDLAAVNQQLSLEELCTIHEYKTGALLKACVEMPLAICHDASPFEAALLQYAKAMGLAFQIKDDLLDHHQAMAKQEPSYVELMGYQQAEQTLKDLHEDALDSISQFGKAALYLRELASFVVKRSH